MTIGSRYSRCNPNLDRGSGHRFQPYPRDNGKLGMLGDPYHFTARKSTKVAGVSDKIWFLAGACNATPAPLSSPLLPPFAGTYCLGCDTNAIRVIMSIRFEHYIPYEGGREGGGGGWNPRSLGLYLNTPLVTHREGVPAS